MEFTLASIISNLLVLQLRYLNGDIENFFSKVKFTLQTLQNSVSVKWSKTQFFADHTTTSDETRGVHVSSCNKATLDDETNVLHVSEIDWTVTRLLGGKENYFLEGNNVNESSSGLCVEDDLVGLFDEEEPSFEEIKETFEVFDANKDGFIDACELQRVLVCVFGLEGSGCNLEECKRMIKSFDTNGDGLIDFQEFVIFMEKCLC
ncbi:hypothetical protein ABFS83_05G008400 [Erythranthe nasuta]